MLPGLYKLLDAASEINKTVGRIFSMHIKTFYYCMHNWKISTFGQTPSVFKCIKLGNLRFCNTVIIMNSILAPKAANLITCIDALCGKQMNPQHK